MIKIKGDFYLDHRTVTNVTGQEISLPVYDGLTISKKIVYSNNEYQILKIADILWSASNNECYIRTEKNHFQDNVVLYEDFKDFILLVDEAYLMIHLLREQISLFVK